VEIQVIKLEFINLSLLTLRPISDGLLNADRTIAKTRPIVMYWPLFYCIRHCISYCMVSCTKLCATHY